VEYSGAGLTANAAATDEFYSGGEEKPRETFADPRHPALFGCQGSLPASGSAM
jgi:hypothetical protein